MKSIICCFVLFALFVAFTSSQSASGVVSNSAAVPACRNGAIGCSTDADCITYTSPDSYCMNYAPHISPYVCHGCTTGTGCCDLSDPSCRNGAIGCSTDTDCITYTSPNSYCMNYPPHTAPYVCHGCTTGTGCCTNPISKKKKEKRRRN